MFTGGPKKYRQVAQEQLYMQQKELNKLHGLKLCYTLDKH